MDGVGQCPVAPIAGCCFCFLLMLFTVIALPMSFSSLEQGFYALKLNWHTQLIDDAVVEKPGMKFVGLGNMLVEYPSTFQMMYFISTNWNPESGEVLRAPIRSRTQDGLEIVVSLSFQWRLAPESLHPLYTLLGDSTAERSSYRECFIRLARGTIVEATSHFPATAFFVNRTEITRVLIQKLQATFSVSTDANGFVSQGGPAGSLRQMAMIRGLQLREVDVPAAYSAEISATQLQMQEVDIALAERERERTTMQTRKLMAELNVLERLTKSNGTAEMTLILNAAQVRQKLFLQESVALGYSDFLKEFANNTAPYTRAFEMMEVRTLESHSAGHLMVTM